MRWITAFVRFWYDFIIGDDWRIAVGVLATVIATDVAAHHGFDWWWLLPLTVAGLLAASVSHERRRHVN